MRLFHRLAARRLISLVLAGCLIVTLLVAWATAHVAERLFLNEIGTRAQATLELQSAALDSLLDKYRILPPILARRPDLVALVRAGDREAGQQIAVSAAGMTGAEEVRILDAAGRLIASSDFEATGNAFDEEIVQAVNQARQGRLGRQLLVTSPGQPASYVFAAPVRFERRIVGVVAARVALERVEQAWALARDPVMALDRTGRIVASNRAAWRGLRLAGGSTRAGDDNLWAEPVIRGARKLHSLPVADGRRLYLRAEKPLAVLGWSVAVFADATAASREAATATAVAILLCVIASGVVWALLERRRQFVRHMRSQRASALRLERRVRDRTRDLTKANARLAREVAERQATEAALRRAQDDLVQTAKLATLGQMSAALSHEFNQPLAIIRSHADNAEILLQRGRADAAGESLRKIAGMVDRMARISGTLKGFARKPGKDVQPVPVGPVIDEALMLLSPRIKRSDAEVRFNRPGADLAAIGDHIRLEQVVMNLVGNALDAVEGIAYPRVDIQAQADDGEVIIRVADNGTGVDAATRDQIFDPFFTTKDVGKGLGLGLSIADKIIRDFGGQIVLEDGESGETVFCIRLPRARARAAAAE
ncbi:ATP-binding protein [Breoghania sp. L-A4]|uniref:sensor histidine kinase n=1 Tax=Breoghania sp. L-A4 TaxID=2304600 RepID=UPI000E35A443|nr:ATP-binding protein [Breoghania sp. L-A4]AXS41953.1 sensor histidine kinase [Breoghania sp. L-A4]